MTLQRTESNLDFSEVVRSFLIAHSEIIRVRNRYTVKRSPFTIRLPRELSKNLCWLIGILQGDGNISKTRIHVSETNRAFHKELAGVFRGIFGVELHVYRDEARNTWYSYLKSTIISAFLKETFSLNDGRKMRQKVPRLIQKSDVKQRSAYVSGLFDSESYLSRRQAAIEFSISDKSIAEFVSQTLDEVGIEHSARTKSRRNRKSEHLIEIYGRRRVRRFREKIGFRHPLKLIQSRYT